MGYLDDIISLSNNDVNKQNKLIYSYQKDKVYLKNGDVSLF